MQKCAHRSGPIRYPSDQIFTAHPQHSTMVMKNLLISIACAYAAISHAAETASFADRCEKMTAESKLSIVFEDVPLARDNTRSLEELKRLSQLTPSPHHFVYGLTRAQAHAAYEIRAVVLTDTDGSTCATPSIAFKIGLSDLTVYLAKELTNTCKRDAVDDHEQEHVNTWRSHMRDGARLLDPLLRERLLRPVYFNRAEEVQPGLQRQVDAVLGPLMDKLQKDISANNGQIDSPSSYRITAQRISACP